MTYLAQRPPAASQTVCGSARKPKQGHHELEPCDVILLGTICVVALSARVLTYALYPGLLDSVEIFQFHEPAHRWVFGTGLIAWEQVVGIRSPIIPGFLAALALLCKQITTNPDLYRHTASIAACVVTTIPTGFAYVIGLRSFGRAAAILASTLNATWFECLHYAPHFIADTITGTLLITTLYFCWPCQPQTSPVRLRAAGALCALTFVIRPQLAPALIVAALYAVLPAPRNIRPFTIGAVPVLVLSGLFDWATLGTPFQSIWLYYVVNQVWHVSGAYGTEPFYWYAASELVFWLGAGPVLIYAATLGARATPAITATLAVAFLSFSAVGHKEVRFLYALLPLFLILIGIGTAELLRVRSVATTRDRWKTGAACAAWCALSFALGFLSPYKAMWNLGRGPLEAFEAVNHDPRACGLALYPASVWAHTYGQSYLRADIRMSAATPAAILEHTPAANYVLDEDEPPDHPAPPLRFGAYHQVGCWSDLGPNEVCLLRRPGGCNYDPDTDELKPDPGAAVAKILRAHRILDPHLYTTSN